jgi:DNA/RNA endonuclease G (NUC1)
VTVLAGQPASFSVVATGTAPLTYQWRKDGTPVSGATSATYPISSAQSADAGTYTVVVTNSAGSVTSNGAALTVNALPTAPGISAQPTSQTVSEGGSVSFRVTATGDGTLTYQWMKEGSALTGKTASSLTINSVALADAGSYTVVVTNTLHGATATTTSAAATLTVNPLPSTPVIGAQPASLTVALGASASFSVTATANGTLAYQWMKDGSALASQTASSLIINPVALADAGSYTVVVTNTLNGSTANATSAAAILTVTPAPATHFGLSGFPASTAPGTAQTFTVTALDASNGGVTGYRGTIHFTSSDPAATLPADYTFTATDAGVHSFSARLNTAGAQSITATDTSSSITGSQSDIVVAAVAPTIQTQPQTQTVLPPDSVAFHVTATANGGGTLTYAWKKNGTAIPGATTSSYTVPSTEFATNTDAYTVTVSEGSASTDSNTVYALAFVPSPTYAGDPVPIPSRPLTVLPSLHVDAVNFPNGAFRLGYDETLKNPVWTAYVNFPVQSPYANSSADYTADTRLAAPQVGKDDYTGIYTGGANYPDSYDRGHQVPRADISYRYTTVAGDDATIMSNLVPQISQFNQQTWQKLEGAIGGTAGGSSDGLTSFKGRVWVYTGSVFPASPTWWHSPIQAGLNIAIPVACYKIVVHETAPGRPEVLAVLMPNVWGLANSNATLTKYVTSVAHIESLTGLDFFPNLATVAPSLDIPTWKATVDVRGWRTPFEQASGPNVHVVDPSYDTTVDVGSTLGFAGAATPSSSAVAGTTIATTTWNFGDSTPTDSSISTSHTFNTTGSFTVSFSADDSLGSSNTLTRVIRVIPPASSNTAPTTTPTTILNQTTTTGQAITVAFTVADDRTLPGAVSVTATSDNTTLLPASGIAISNSTGSVSLVLTPTAGQTGSASITVTLTDGDGSAATKTFLFTVNGAATNVLTEGFESGTKTSYATGAVVFTSGSWTLNDALVGTSASDRKTGLQSIRVRNGIVTMGFDWPSGAQTVTVNHAKYGSDADSTWELWYSTNGGTSWTVAGPAVTSSATTLTQATFTVNVNSPIRFEFRKSGGTTTRFNLDDFQINGY